jgi:cytochrome c
MKILAKVLVVLIIGAAAAYWYFTRPPLGQILVFSKTAEYRHESIAAGVAALTEIAKGHRYHVVATEDAADINATSLPGYRAVIFLNTTGEVLDLESQEALERYIQAGGGFVGIHAAADTHWKTNDWPWYTRLVGAAFLTHPNDPSNVQSANLQVIDQQNPLTQMFDATFDFSDEWYDYHRLSENIQVLLTADEDSYQGAVMGDHHPVAWFQEFDGGRSFYTNFGHQVESFADQRVRAHLWAGIEYAMGDGQLDYSQAKPENWRLKRVILDAGLDEPMAMDFTPQGELFYVQRRGKLMRFDVEQGQSLEVAEFEVMSDGEYGLIGMAFDPNFESNQWLYIFRNLREGETGEYRLSRFQMLAGAVELDSEQIILQIPTEVGRGNHTGGSLIFGPEGNLWISTGDTTNPHASDGFSPHDDRSGHEMSDASRSAGNTMDLRGKILRIKMEEDGAYSIPEGNLFGASDNGRPEIFVMGLRNPFRFSVDQRSGTLYWGEVGPDSRDYSDSRGPWGYDEFNRTDQAGNYGWPFVIGNNEPYAYYDFATEQAGEFVNPAAPENRSANNTGARVLPPAQPAWMPYPYTLDERFIELGDGGRSAMAGPVYYSDDYPANPVKLPPYYDGKLFIYEWVRHWVQAVQMDASGVVKKIEPVLDIGLYSAPIDLKFAPDGSLYILEYGSAWFAPNDDAYLSRIEYYGDDNPPPLVKIGSDQRVGPAPMTVALRGSDSFDRNGVFEELKFSWDRIENGQVVEHIGDTADVEYVAADPGDYKIRLTVTDADGVSSEDGLILEVGNAAPVIDVSFNAGNSSVFWDDASVEYTVTVTDAEDGSTLEGGIDPRSVQVSVEYVPQGEDLANAILGHQKNQGVDGWSEIEASDCLSCHARERASVGPSFNAIAERYAGDESAAAALSEKILQGSHGNWGDYAMPPHPQLSQEQASAMSAWILDPSIQPELVPGLPLQGTIEFDRHQQDYLELEMVGRLYTGRYLLLVSYTDRGAPGAHSQSAEYNHTWMPPKTDGDSASETQHVMVMPVPVEGMQGSSVAIYRSGEGERGWMMFRDFDLTNIATIRVGLATSSMLTIAGEFSLRLDSSDGELVETLMVENSGMGLPDTVDYFDFDVSHLNGSRDIYLTTENLEKESARPDYILGTVEYIEAEQ